MPENDPVAMVNLQGAEDSRLNSRGELEVSSLFQSNIQILVADDLLELTRISMKEHEYDQFKKEDSVFVLRNLRRTDAQPMVLNHGTQKDVNEVGTVHVIGRKDTPELKLEQTTSRYHFQIRIGAHANALYFKDLKSMYGTAVILGPQDVVRTDQL